MSRTPESLEAELGFIVETHWSGLARVRNQDGAMRDASKAELKMWLLLLEDDDQSTHPPPVQRAPEPPPKCPRCLEFRMLYGELDDKFYCPDPGEYGDGNGRCGYTCKPGATLAPLPAGEKGGGE